MDRLGFGVKFDYVMDEGQRWVMLTPPGGGADITLVTWFRDTTPQVQGWTDMGSPVKAGK